LSREVEVAGMAVPLVTCNLCIAADTVNSAQ